MSNTVVCYLWSPKPHPMHQPLRMITAIPTIVPCYILLVVLCCFSSGFLSFSLVFLTRSCSILFYLSSSFDYLCLIVPVDWILHAPVHLHVLWCFADSTCSALCLARAFTLVAHGSTMRTPAYQAVFKQAKSPVLVCVCVRFLCCAKSSPVYSST